MGVSLQCSECGKWFRTNEPRSVGTFWQPVYAAICPQCGTEKRFALDVGNFDVDRFISEMVDDKYAAKKNKMPIAEQVRLDAVPEYWVQRYIAANYEQLGFTGLKGSFDSGPDFRALHNRKWVLAEAEVVCENYIRHKHHEDPKWESCAILIVLSEKQPDEETKRHLPKTIIHIDKVHFTEWYRTTAREYALDREQEEPAKKVRDKVTLQLQLLANEIRKRFDIDDGWDDTRLFDDLAFKFVMQWMAGKGGEFKLVDVTSDAIDEFCRSVAAFLGESDVRL